MDDKPNDLPIRVAVMEQIAKDTRDVLARIEVRMGGLSEDIKLLGSEVRGDLRDLRKEVHDDMAELRKEVHDDMAELRSWHASDFRWIIGIMLGTFGALLAVMAHGFHWL